MQPELEQLLAIIRAAFDAPPKRELVCEVVHSAPERGSPIGRWNDPLKVRVHWAEGGRRLRPVILLCVEEASVESYLSSDEPSRAEFHKRLSAFIRKGLDCRDAGRSVAPKSEVDYWEFSAAL